jgi:hypothetical protein
LLGPVLGTVVLQRGLLALHASAANVEGRAVAVCAASGTGKSVTAAAMYRRGFPLVTDDVLAVSLQGPDALVIPAYPLVKLWPEGAQALDLSQGSLEGIAPGAGRLVLDARRGFRRGPLPLGAIVSLEVSNEREPTATELVGGKATATLVEHSYGTSALRQAVGLAPHFEQITELVRRTRVIRLTVPRSMGPTHVGEAVVRAATDLIGTPRPRLTSPVSRLR